MNTRNMILHHGARMFGLLLLSLPLYAQLPAGDQCVSCHADLDDDATREYRGSVHARAGVSCSGCHGGDARLEDMDEAMSPARGFIGVPKGTDISRRCGSCHDDAERMAGFGSKAPVGQFAQLRGSVHNRGVAGEDALVLQCTTCHGAHGIKPPGDPASSVSRVRIVAVCASCHSSPEYMRRYNPSLPTDQLAKYRTSLHGKRNLAGDMRVAACADCHTAHDIRPAEEAVSSVNAERLPGTCGRCHSDPEYMKPYGLSTTQQKEYEESVHGVALLEKHDASAPSCNDCHGNHGAAPPQVESISYVCGECHALNADLFRQSRHKEEFESQNKAECETCHGKHAIREATISLLDVEGEGVCASCHTVNTAPVGYGVARTMRALLDSLELAVLEAERLILQAERKGMEIDDIRFSLRDARQARLQSRTAVHAFSLESFREVVDPGLAIARRALQDAEGANHEYTYRRVGLAVATLIITLTVVLLALYIRRIDRRQEHERTAA